MRKYKILIVDDERPLAEMIRLNFPEEQFDARTCYSGKEAIEEALSFRPDVLILDVMMGGMDGWEVLSALKANPRTAAIPVIMCTAKDDPKDVEKSFQYGAQSYVIKPINFTKLMTKVSAVLDTEELLKD